MIRKSYKKQDTGSKESCAMAETCFPEDRNQPRMAILVISHKHYWKPDNHIYYPLQVGAAISDINLADWFQDNTGDNISGKNRTFCELTGLYWAWKNLGADVYGLCHYRRYLGSPRFFNRLWKHKQEQILTETQTDSLLENHDIILPRKRHYWIETRESQYAHAHHIQDLRCVEKILSERYPDYLQDWKWMLGTRSGHICNMFIMRRGLLDDYCSWLFDILFEAEKRLDISSYSEKDRRVFGYLGERLLDVWVRKNGLSYTEVPIINMERQHWLKKGMAFIKRKTVGA